ncbi:MAG: helix-turn-helix transcriptional regulator [Chloroflexota bacterium]
MLETTMTASQTMSHAMTRRPDEIYQRLGQSVRTLRRARDLTQHELAERAGMNKTYLVRIEAGDKNITLKTAQKLAFALNTDLVTLLKGVKLAIQ